MRTLRPWEIFRTPVALAILSLFGLVAALVGDGVWDALGAGALALSLLWPATVLLRRRSST